MKLLFFLFLIRFLIREYYIKKKILNLYITVYLPFQLTWTEVKTLSVISYNINYLTSFFSPSDQLGVM